MRSSGKIVVTVRIFRNLLFGMVLNFSVRPILAMFMTVIGETQTARKSSNLAETFVKNKISKQTHSKLAKIFFKKRISRKINKLAETFEQN